MLVLISGATVMTGLVQLLGPEFVLRVVGADSNPPARHFFAIIGMFMMLFGGALLHALFTTQAQPVVVLWAALQKVGAAAVVGLGVFNGVFGAKALAIAGFDLLSGLLIGMYLLRLRSGAPASALEYHRASLPAGL